jgi:hypothetical protein
MIEDAQAASELSLRCALVPHGYGGGLNATLPAGCVLLRGWRDLLDSWEAVGDGEGLARKYRAPSAGEKAIGEPT